MVMAFADPVKPFFVSLGQTQAHDDRQGRWHAHHLTPDSADSCPRRVAKQAPRGREACSRIRLQAVRTGFSTCSRSRSHAPRVRRLQDFAHLGQRGAGWRTWSRYRPPISGPQFSSAMPCRAQGKPRNRSSQRVRPSHRPSQSGMGGGTFPGMVARDLFQGGMVQSCTMPRLVRTYDRIGHGCHLGPLRLPNWPVFRNRASASPFARRALADPGCAPRSRHRRVGDLCVAPAATPGQGLTGNALSRLHQLQPSGRPLGALAAWTSRALPHPYPTARPRGRLRSRARSGGTGVARSRGMDRR